MGISTTPSASVLIIDACDRFRLFAPPLPHFEEVIAAFDRGGEAAVEEASTADGETPETPSLARVEWEHIQRVLTDCGGNITKAAERLGIHRRSLQRKLSKFPVPR